MTSRLRERQRRPRGGARDAARKPAVYRGGALPRPEPPEKPVEHGAKPRSAVNWRLFSALIVLLLVGILALFLVLDAFYVRTISVAGLTYMPRDEVFTLSGIVSEGGYQHLFWLDPEEIRQNILRSPSVADARVYIGWPPETVQVIIQEREPSLVWVQSGVAVWLDLQGRVMRQRVDLPHLLRVDSQLEGVPSPSSELVPDVELVVSGALQLRELLPSLSALRYHPDNGLGFTDPGGWEAWFGSGSDMPVKIVVYRALVQNLTQRGIIPREINVIDPDAPFYAVWGQ